MTGEVHDADAMSESVLRQEHNVKREPTYHVRSARKHRNWRDWLFLATCAAVIAGVLFGTRYFN